MSFVPLSGPVCFRAAEPPRAGMFGFTDAAGEREIELPVRSAVPVLSKALGREDVHPTVALSASAVHLGLRLVAGGRLRPSVGAWQLSLREDDEDRVRRLARARADDLGEDEAEARVRAVLAAVGDAMPRSAPLTATGGPARVAGRDRPRASPSRPDPWRPTGRDFSDRVAARIARLRRGEAGDDGRELAQLVRLSLRVEADEEELVAGAVRLVLQVHDERDPLRVADAALLFTDTGDALERGFGHRARTHASIALRGAAEAWPVLERLAELRVPDQITLDTDEIVSLLDTGVAALGQRGIDVLWPRSLGRDLLGSSATLEPRDPPEHAGGRDEPMDDPPLSTDKLFAFRWQVALGGDPLSEEEMAELARAAGPIIKLRGTWVVVDPATARKAKRRLIRTVGPGEAVAAALTGRLRVDDAEEQVIVGASLTRVRDRIGNAATKEPLPDPDALDATLRPYQRQGLTWLTELTDAGLGACLADDMGLGKTITLIALHLQRVASGTARGRATLVVCPTSLLGNWETEIRRFAPGVPVRRFHGGARSLAGLDTHGADPGFVLTTYGTARSSAEDLAGHAWGLVVADEAQHIKNPRSQIARVLRTFPATARVALTGTPVENNLTELWAILDWATPGLLGSRHAFRRSWAMHIESGQEPKKAAEFAELIAPFLLRRRKSDPGIAPELPAKTATDHLLALTREQAVLYEAFVRDTMTRIEQADELARRGLVLALLTGCKQICNHPAQFLKESGNGRIAGRSEKLELLDELLETVRAEGGAALVFTQYVAMARLLARHLSRHRIEHQFLHGGTPVAEREAMVRRFQDSPDGEAPVFLLSLKAGGTGLNLTRADHVVHVDRWWNPAVEDQATDRAYRIGQTKPVQVHRMVTRGTIEERVAQLLESKRALADAVLAQGEAALTELSDAELRDLVELRR